MYSLLRKLLFTLPPELSHSVALTSLKVAYALGLTRFFTHQTARPCTVMGLHFPHIIGLAAGLDKNADYVDALAALGFGFIEIGTVTPQPQKGNPKPRLFRLEEQEAIINRMGFNNKGVDYVAKRLEKMRYRGIIGINLGKNKDTPLEKATEDYLIGFRALWKYASYITINISSPNTAGLRDLQQTNYLMHLLTTLKNEQQVIFQSQQKYIPLVLKISPDLNEEDVNEIALVLLQTKMDAVIATNTTLDRNGVTTAFANETGGLSGRPLLERSTQTIRLLHATLKDHIPIIASGGVMDAKAIAEKLEAGAALIQVYTGFIYSGSHIISSA